MADLKKIFENYDKAGDVPVGGFSKDDFNKNPKAKALVDIIRSAMENLKKKAAEIFDDFNVNFNITATDRIDEPYVNAVNFDFKSGADKENLLISLNFNFSKLASLPGPEAYAFVYSSLHKSLLEKKKSMPNANEYKFGKDVEAEEEKVEENDQNFNRKGEYSKPKNIFIEYIKAFIRKLLGLDVDVKAIKETVTQYNQANINFGSESAASDIAKTFAENGITPNELFDNPPDLSKKDKAVEEEPEEQSIKDRIAEEFSLDGSDIEKGAQEQKAPAKKETSSSKYQFDFDILDEELFASRYGKLVKQGRHQQATFLLGVFTQDEMNSLKSGNEADIKSFCEKFARRFLQNNGVDASSYKITYDKYDSKGNEKAAGSYLDYGDGGNVININLDKIKTANNPAEIVMILAHELTHLVESYHNKAKGKTVPGGYGLLHNKIGNTSGLANVEMTESAEVYQYVKQLTEVCYRLNPNERSAREGELIAVEFMKRRTNNVRMQSYINTSIENYKVYQKTVLSNYNSVGELMAKAKSMKAQARSVETKNIIDERIAYLNELKEHKLLNVNGVESALTTVQKLKEGDYEFEGPSNS